MSYVCSNPWTTLFVWGGGDVTHCCYSNIGPLGNLGRQSLAEIWNGRKLRCIRDRIAANDFIGAGCEYYCRSFRWNEFYGAVEPIPPIPDGLGRIDDFNIGSVFRTPQVIGVGIDWACNLNCRHCLSSKEGRGLEEKYWQALLPYIGDSRIIRFMGGEFSINSKCLRMIKTVSELPKQPTLFMSTNGQVSLNSIIDPIDALSGFHLKFSFEGLGSDYEFIRRGGKWTAFHENLATALRLFRSKREKGLDWRIYLNFCVMKSNISALPEIMRYAIERDTPLVLNTLNGMRHIDENIFMFDSVSQDELRRTEDHCLELLSAHNDYAFQPQMRRHLDYIFRSMKTPKLALPKRLLKLLIKAAPGHSADVLLYGLYKLKRDKSAFLLYFSRKLRNKLQRLLSRRKAESCR